MQQVSLRSFRREDARAVLRWFSTREAVLGLVEYRETFSLEEAEVWVARAMGGFPEDRKWAIWASGHDEPVGFTAIYGLGKQTAPSFGILIGDRAAWGRGVGTEAARQTLERAFGELGAPRVQLTVLRQNAKARHIYESLGFVHEGVLRSHVTRAGVGMDLDVYGLLAAEWAASRKGPANPRPPPRA